MPCLKAVVAGVNPLQMKQGIEKAVDDITGKLQSMSIKIKEKNENQKKNIYLNRVWFSRTIEPMFNLPR